MTINTNTKKRNAHMNELVISARQTPGVVTFDNFDAVKADLKSYIAEHYALAEYTLDDYDTAVADRDELKKLRDTVTKKQKELKEAYSAPYAVVEGMLNELVDLIDGPYKKAKSFVEGAEKDQKKLEIMSFAKAQADTMGDVGRRIAESPAFFHGNWLLKTYTVKKYQDEIRGIFKQAASDIKSIQSAGGEQTDVLLATYYETLSMDRVKSFLETMRETSTVSDEFETEGEHNAVGYKILKITGTEDQLAAVMDQLELLGVEVEEIEDGMPKAMEELTEPDFDSFVAFDIETTGTFGAARGDHEARITEIGAVRVVNGVVTEKFDELANPGRKIVPSIANLTHITDEMVADKPPVDEVIRRFHAFVGDSILVGHNIKSSDLRYITKAADKAGVHFDVPYLDTYILGRRFREQMGWEKLTLSYLSGLYGFEHKEVHRAWSDAEVNVRVYFEMQKLNRAMNME